MENDSRWFEYDDGAHHRMDTAATRTGARIRVRSQDYTAVVDLPPDEMRKLAAWLTTKADVIEMKQTNA